MVVNFRNNKFKLLFDRPMINGVKVPKNELELTLGLFYMSDYYYVIRDKKLQELLG